MKELPLSRRKRLDNSNQSKKLKLLCSFNGAFRPWQFPGKLPYVGGETRIISVDRNIGFAKFRSKIGDLCPNVASFSLKYQLPESDVAENLLVLIASDEDFRCMIEEYDKLELYGKHSRLWVYVCNNNEGNENHNGNRVGLAEIFMGGGNGFESESRKLETLLCGPQVNGGKVAKNSGSDKSLRKMVLKQQMLAKQSAVMGLPLNRGMLIPIFEEPSRMNVSSDKRTSRSDNCGDSVQFPVTRSIPLHPRDGNLSVETKGCLDNVLANGSVIPSQSASTAEFRKQGNCSGVISACNGYDVKQGSRNTEMAGVNEFNRENVMPCPATCDLTKTRGSSLRCGDHLATSAFNQKSLSPGNRVCGAFQSSIRNYGFGENETRNQRVFPYYAGNNQNNLIKIEDQGTIRLDGRFSKARCYPEFTGNVITAKQGQSMIGRYPSSQFRSSSFEDGYSVYPSLYNGVESQISPSSNVVGSSTSYMSTVDTESDLLASSSCGKRDAVCQTSYEDLYGEPMNFEPSLWDVEKEAFLVNSFKFANIWGVSEELARSNENGSKEVQALENKEVASSVNISLYEFSSSSSREAKDSSLSYCASNDVSSEALSTPQSTPVDVLDKAQISSTLQVDGSNVLASKLSFQNARKMEKDNGQEEEIQHDPLTGFRIDEKIGTKESHKCSKGISDIANDLTAFYTRLATRELQIIKNFDLEYIKELGSGTYGTVFYGKWKGSAVAIKKIKPTCFTKGTLEQDRLVADFWKEAHILGQLHHPNIVTCYGVVTDGPVTELATVTEYMVNGSLREVLQRKDRTIDRRKRLIIAMDAAFGMEYLHVKGIVHFDLKSHNFLVNMRDPLRPVCKIGDLGLSKIKRNTLVSGGVRGTIPWMAPELLDSKNMVTEKVDVYSFGIVMWELLTGEEPYAKMRSKELIAGIINGSLRPEIPSWCDPTWRSLMERCWSSDPDSRPAFSEIAKELRTMSAAMNIT